MSRRIHVSAGLRKGRIELDSAQAHHVRDVLRLKVGDQLEAFDNSGKTAAATIGQSDESGVILLIDRVESPQESAEIIIASAIPKGDRADWMIEKLSELGVTRFIPLKTDRSVVHPTGASKRERWLRIATESAKQSRRNGVMRIDELTELKAAMAEAAGSKAFFLSTEPNAAPISSFSLHPSSFAFIGPEGGWSDAELSLFQSANLTGAKLTGTILRVETAAVAAAAMAACLMEPKGSSGNS